MYRLVLLVEEKDTSYTYIKYKIYFKINLIHFIDINITHDWMQSEYDWKSIFEIIKKN